MLVIIFVHLHQIFLQSIPADMEFDPNSNPPCYKTKDEVSRQHFRHDTFALFDRNFIKVS